VNWPKSSMGSFPSSTCLPQRQVRGLDWRGMEELSLWAKLCPPSCFCKKSMEHTWGPCSLSRPLWLLSQSRVTVSESYGQDPLRCSPS
jgi:hypothetical protein